MTYVGEFVLDGEQPWFWDEAPSTSGPLRKVIMFRLVPQGAVRTAAGVAPPASLSPSLDTEYEDVDENVATAPRSEMRVDPDAVDRGLRGHRRTQNAVARWARQNGFRPLKPGPGDPAFDTGWWEGDVFVVVEVKSLSNGLSQVGQLRLGLGQVLDYDDQLRAAGKRTRPVLAVEREPDERWIRVCSRQGVLLVSPETLERLGGGA
ncbi:MAG: hypothetical protein O3B31_07350 [Chloroflexi bacterium]|nr:hypothetical protein [Chloroflexota bacterium]